MFYTYYTKQSRLKTIYQIINDFCPTNVWCNKRQRSQMMSAFCWSGASSRLQLVRPVALQQINTRQSIWTLSSFLFVCRPEARLTWGLDGVISSRSWKQPCLWRMRSPHSAGRWQDGHLPSTGSRWVGSSRRKYLARQTRWLLIPHRGWKQLSSSEAWGRENT